MIISFDKVDINYGSNWDKHYPKIPQDEPIIFWDEFHCDRLYPFIEGVPGGWNEIYLILTSEFKQEKIYYVTSDFNIEWQVEKVKKAIVENGEEIKTKIHFLYHPYTMCYDEFFRLNNNKILGVTKNTLWDGSKYKTFDYKYNFISLNGTRKKHRVMLVRQMYQQKNFVYSYYPFEDEGQLDHTFDIESERKYLNELTELNEIYDPDIFDSVIDKPLIEQTREEVVDKMENKWQAFQHSVPLEYIQSCVDLVTDAFFDDGLSFTEKTWKPVAHKKPYILMSSRNVHKYLKIMGYELYDELFDYSFDDKDFNKRFKSIVKQVKNLCEIPTKDFSNEILKLNDKIEHNYHHFNKQRSLWSGLAKIEEEGTDYDFLSFLEKHRFKI